MLRLDSTDVPVDVPTLRPETNPLFAALFVACFPLGVLIRSAVGGVHWWGWLGAILATIATVWVARRPRRSGRTVITLTGDRLEFTDQDSRRSIDASRVRAVVSRGASLVPLLVLDDGEEVRLPVRAYWQDSAVPTARLLAGWVQEHGGGRSPEPLDHDIAAPPPGPGNSTARVVVGALLGTVGWLAVRLCLAAWFGESSPRLQGGVGVIGGTVFGALTANRTAPGKLKVWSA